MPPSDPREMNANEIGMSRSAKAPFSVVRSSRARWSNLTREEGGGCPWTHPQDSSSRLALNAPRAYMKSSQSGLVSSMYAVTLSWSSSGNIASRSETSTRAL